MVATVPILKAPPAKSEDEKSDVQQHTLLTTDGAPAKLTRLPLKQGLALHLGSVLPGSDWVRLLLPKLAPAIAPVRQPVDYGGGRFRVPGSQISPIKRTKPRYPSNLDWNQISNTTVAVKVFLNQSGIVTGAEAIRGDPVLRKVAQEMILQWTFDVESLSLPAHAQVIELSSPFTSPRQSSSASQ